MENFLFTLNAVLPLACVMAAGYVCRRLSMLPEPLVRGGNNLVYRVFLPALLFQNIAGAQTGGDPGLLLFVGAAVLALFGLLFLIIPRLEKQNARRGVLIQGIGRSNYAFYGFSLVTLLYPDRDLSVASLVVAVAVPLFNVLSVVALEVYGEKKTDKRKIVLDVLKNPLIIASVLGIIALRLSVPIPAFLSSAVGQLAKAATPLALFLLGGTLSRGAVRGLSKPLCIATLGKLVVSPAIFVTAAALLGFRGPELACVAALFGAPTAVNSFTMAQQLGGDDRLAAMTVVFTTLASVGSVFVLIFVLKTLALI